MTEYKDYDYNSSLAPYIRGLLAEKRALGFIYNTEAYNLKRFDRYWIAHKYADTNITPERVSEWLCCLPGESKSSQGNRVIALKNLSIYMNALGISSYIPLVSVGADHNTVHILSNEEIRELFLEIDTYKPTCPVPNQVFFRMADEYPVMFRLYYCCGMRNDEVCSLKTADVDMRDGILTIWDGKGHKDRLVYMPDDLRRLAERYFRHLEKNLGFEPEWFFPGRRPDKHISKNHIDKKFGEFWNRTEASKNCDKKPTPHCLRHTFVVNRINQWIFDGVDVNVMLVYLSKYLGHKDPDESFYYYHMVSDAFKIIRQKDSVAGKVIPEVRRR